MNDSNLNFNRSLFLNSQIVEIYYYFKYLLFFMKNKLTLTLSFYINLFKFINFKNFNFLLKSPENPKYNKIYNNFIVDTEKKHKNVFIVKQNPFSQYQHLSHIFYLNKILVLLLCFDFFILNTSSKCHHNFFLLFGRRFNSINWLNNNRFINFWKNAFILIYNINYFNIDFFIFGSPLFKKLILAHNWKYFSNEINLWKFSFPFFFFKTNKFSKQVEFFHKKISRTGSTFLIITDSFYHYKNLYYFNKYNYFTLGLASASLNPWKLSFAVPSLNNNFFTQNFFFKIISLLKQFAFKNKFYFYYILWTSLWLNK